ncbi:hypothetical protein Tcan_16656 [Toxocara canis]|uniref:Arrestin C-terminal-like domain-containing protein n=1 Tax=Toxocara canis TaxID=6265 RepID=A0A0B2VLF3_TOXCA|nr:hypothetical protein Tcan_16656 [Toxocara canis]
MRPVIVVPIVDVSRCLAFRAPVRIQKTFRKKVFCFKKTDTSITIELQKAAFILGERILVRGEIINEHPSNSVKGGLVELVMLIRCRCKSNERTSATTVAHFAIDAVPLQSISSFEHTLQVPMDAFPTFLHDDFLMQCSYHLSVSVHECLPIEIPLIIGTGKPTTPINRTYHAIMGPQHDSPQTNEYRRPAPSQLPPFFPPPPPPYAFVHYGAIPNATMFVPSYIRYGNAPLPQFFSKANYHNTHTGYEGQSVLRIEEIE